jgi:hypothetical protein
MLDPNMSRRKKNVGDVQLAVFNVVLKHHGYAIATVLAARQL